MCQGGHVRSVGLKYLLRYGGYNCDVLACGWEGNTEATRRMLYGWADTIIVMQKQFADHVPAEFHTNADGSRKLFCYDVGEDRFGNPFHPELQATLKALVEGHGLFKRNKN